MVKLQVCTGGDSEISEQSDTETVNALSKSDKTPNIEWFLGNLVVNIDTNDPSDLLEVVRAVVGDDLI